MATAENRKRNLILSSKPHLFSQEATGFDVQTRFRTTKLLIETTQRPPIWKIINAKLVQEKKVLTKLVELLTILLRKTEKSKTTTTVALEIESLPIGATHG